MKCEIHLFIDKICRYLRSVFYTGDDVSIVTDSSDNTL